MIDVILRLIRREIEDEKARGGMRVGLPQVRVPIDKLEYLCNYAEVAKEYEWLEEKVSELVYEKTGDIYHTSGGVYRALRDYIERLEAK